MIAMKWLQRPMHSASFVRKELFPSVSFHKRWVSRTLTCMSEAKNTEEVKTVQLPDEIVGQVMSAEANFVRVKVLDSESHQDHIPLEHKTWLSYDSLAKNELLCVVRSVLKKMKYPVLVGDFVKVIAIDWPDLRGMVSEVLPRKSELKDPPVANIDHIVVLVSVSQPKFDTLQTTRFLLEAESVGVPVTLALNKIDLQTKEEVTELHDRLVKWGYGPTMLSCLDGDGLDQLIKHLKDRISVVIGPSGVGKSSLINAFRKDSALTAQAVKDVSSAGIGRHTTRTISILELPTGGYLADTPGFNVPDLSAISGQDVSSLFPEIRQLVAAEGSCRYSNCRHVMEPGCIIRTAEWERYPVYLRLLKEIEGREDYERQVLQLSKARRQGTVKKKSRKGGRYREEVLLEPKTHRRVSRTQQQREVQDLLAEDLAEDADDDDEM